MARVQPYERVVDAVLIHTNSALDIEIQNGTKIKEEPTDTTSNTDTTEDYTTVVRNCFSLIDHDYHSYDKSLSENDNSCENINNTENIHSSNDAHLNDDHNAHLNNITKTANIKHKNVKTKKEIHNTLTHFKKQKCSDQVSNNENTNILCTTQNVSKKRKRQSVTLDTTLDTTKIQCINKSAKKKFVECDICFRLFSCLRNCEFHKQYYGVSTDTKFKSSKHYVRRKKFHSYYYVRKTSTYNCNFCSRSFKNKTFLQSHLFHVHSELICFNNTMKHKTCRSEISEDDTLRTNTNEKSLCLNNLVKSEKINATFTNNINISRNDNVINTKTARIEKSVSNEVSPTKKLRQPTLTEYLELYKRKHNIKLSPNKLNVMKDDFPTCSLHHDEQIEKNSKQTEIRKKPFVKLHADVEMMKSFLEKLSDTIIEDKMTENRTSDIISYDRGIPYSLRSISTVSSVDASSNLGIRRNKNVSKKSRFNLEFNKKEENVIDLNKIESKVDWKTVMAYFKCKECTISLTRCDEPSKNSYQISRIKAIENNCLTTECNLVQESDIENKIKLKNVEVSLERLTVVPTIDIKDIKTSDVKEHNNNYFLCKICKKSFSSKLAKRVHIKSFHIAYMSSICNARYKVKHKLLQHYLHEHLFEQNRCCICYILLPDYEALKQHLNVHCLKYIQQQDDRCSIDIELKCNLDEKTCKCHCDKIFSSRISLMAHQSYCTVQKEMGKNQKNSVEEANSYPKDIPEMQHKTDENTITCNERINSDDLCKPLNSDCTKESNKHQISCHSEKESKINKTNRDILVNNLIEEKIETIDKSQDSKKLSENNSVISNQNITNTQLDDVASRIITYPCNICGKQFHNPKNLEIHVRIFSLSTNICPMCGTGFSSKRLLQTHITAAHVPHISKTYTFHCVFCNQGFFKKNDLRSHILHLHGQQMLNTLTWNPNTSQQKSNESTHTAMSMSCNVCNLVFETHDRYVEHRMYYYKNHTFTCSFCAQSFQGMYMFHHHNKLTHCPEDKRKSYNYICDICHEGFNHESHFYSHNMHVHSNEVNLIETVKEFENKSHSFNNQKQITNFSTDQQNEHLSNEYICQICQLKCKNMDHMIKHKEFYSNDGDFRCNKCKRRCRTFDLLDQHRKLTHSCRDIYSGHVCHICSEVLETVVSLKCHEKHFHPNIINNDMNNQKNCSQLSSSEFKNDICNVIEYKCLFCDMNFSTPNTVQTHIVHVHMDDMIAKRATLKLALPIINSNSIQKQFEIDQLPSTSSLSSSASSSSSEDKSTKILPRSIIQQSNDILNTMAENGTNDKTATELLRKFRVVRSRNEIIEKTPISCVNKNTISTGNSTTSNTEPKTDTSVSVSTGLTTRMIAPNTEFGNNTTVCLSNGSLIYKTILNSQSKDNTLISLSESTNNLRKSYRIPFKSGSIDEFKANSAKKSIIINKSKTVPAYLLSTLKDIAPQSWKYNEITNQISESVNSYDTDRGYSCPLCPLEYPSLMFFHAHLKYAHADSIVSIQTEFNIPQMNKTQKASVIECLLCPCTFIDEIKYKKHLRNSHTYYVYIPNSQDMTKMNNMCNPLTRTNINRKSPEIITVDDDDDIRKISNQGTAEVTAMLDHERPNEKIGKLRVKPFAKIIENLSTNSASKFL